MTFNIQWNQVKDRDKHFPPEADGTLNATLNSILWSSLATGINEVTESNWEEVWVRIDMWQTLIGAWWIRIVDDERVAVVVTKEDVHHAVGAFTNASHKSRTQFMKDLMITRYGR